ncbi:MAG: phospho-sugar mutase [Pirellulales bacterium]|nr:phospho-sugar mutase [Pirellulales bacterium]
MATNTLPDVSAALEQLESAAKSGSLTDSAVENIRAWLTEPRYAEYAGQVAEELNAAAHASGDDAKARWQKLDDVFWTIIPFGTGGRRGMMYPIGSNAVNDRTIGESAQGLANYVNNTLPEGVERSCAIAYDTRHRSPEFARLCAEVLVAAGFKVYFLDGHRSTPELSFAVRYKNCSCGIMVTASHNPPSDNAVKVYWSTGGQLVPPHDKGVVEQVNAVELIERADFDTAIAEGKIEMCQAQVDAEFIRNVVAQAIPGPRDLKVIYSPLHGVGATCVPPALEADGFADVEVFVLHAEPSGDFPNVPDHVSNPENVAVFDAIIERAKEVGADLVLATDPDCDRVGCAAPRTTDPASEWKTLNGNQIGALLTDFVLSARKDGDSLSSDDYVVKTLVTSELIRRIADSYDVRTVGNLLVGFKWIGLAMDEEGPDQFVLGTEESHGYLVGQYARDKDAAVASMLLSELAAKCIAERKTLHQKLDELFAAHGCHLEGQVSVKMPGAEGMSEMKALMARFRADPPSELADLPLAAIRDYAAGTITSSGGDTKPLDGPTGDMVIIELNRPGNYVAVRPSGTEPKVKFYLFTYESVDSAGEVLSSKTVLSKRIARLGDDLRKYAGVE